MSDAVDPRRLTDFLRSLRAVREFKPDPIPDDVVNDILEVARWSGSASNRQFGEIILIRRRETLGKLGALPGYAGHVRGAAMAMVIVMPGAWPEGEAFDEGRLAERIMLAAATHGVGSSIGWFQAEGREEAKRILGVPKQRMVRTTISMGYPVRPARRGKRKPISELAYPERYPDTK